jgi:trehalose-6-phosphate synthase
LPERLRAFESLLSNYPVHRRHVRLVQIGSPTRETLPVYQEVREEVERLVGRINGSFGDLSWTPVTYLHRTSAALLGAALPGKRHRTRDRASRRQESVARNMLRPNGK